MPYFSAYSGNKTGRKVELFSKFEELKSNKTKQETF